MGTERFECVANLHVHTDYSDGSGRIDRVIKAAGKAGLNLLLINDHDTLIGRERGYEGYYGRLLVLIGAEISGPHNHYLFYGSRSVPEYNWQQPQVFIDRVREEGGIGFIAHPFETGSPLSEGGHAFTWLDWSVDGFDGMEIWNHTSAWKSPVQTWTAGLWHFFTRTGTLQGPDPETLSKWDEIGRMRPVAGVGGSDAHCKIVRLFGPVRFRIFPYEVAFRAVNTHLHLDRPFSGDIKTDREAVLGALAKGRCHVAHDRLCSSLGFRYHLENKSELRAEAGQEVELRDDDALVWNLPARAHTRILRNGRVILEMTAPYGRLALNAPGVYRLEADYKTRFFGPRPWIYSNPIYVRPSK